MLLSRGRCVSQRAKPRRRRASSPPTPSNYSSNSCFFVVVRRLHSIRGPFDFIDFPSEALSFPLPPFLLLPLLVFFPIEELTRGFESPRDDTWLI